MKFSAAILLTLLLSSCATVIRGTNDKLRVESDPIGAEVALSTGERGVTPVTFVKKRTEGFLVTVSKPGYQTQSVAVTGKLSASGGAAMLGNAIVGGLVGGIIDSASGATKALYPNPVSVVMIPNGQHRRTKPTAVAPPAPVAHSRIPPKANTPRPRFRTDKYGTQYLDPAPR